MTEPIPAGYQIHFTTWENDGDAYKTKLWSGIESAEDVTFLLLLANKFKSQNSQERGLGNGGVMTDDLIEAVESAMAQVPGISRDMRALFEDEREEDEDEDTLADRWYDLIADRILSYPVEESYRYDETRFCRVLSKVQVYYFPQPVEEVTSQFV
jgi:hypothetical protein